MPNEIEKYNSYQMQRLDVNLEFTCIWQVSGENNIGFDEWIEMDIDYIKTRNLWLDINLILKTVGVLFGDDNAL
ncbi:sugar transferase [Romboutsia timonensis]|uniref:sugar transferase n=1 Tax=Romboutsia timonensis TaxID=1776391 RepID=UPI002ED01791